MKQISLNDPITKIALILLGIAFIGYIAIQKFIIKPNKEKVAGLKAQIEHIKAEDEIAVLYNEINACEKALPPQKDQSWLLAQITSIAKQADINIGTVEPLSIRQIPPYSYVPYKINIVCTFAELDKFLELIETSPYILNIESLNISSNAQYVPELPKEEIGKETRADIDIVIGTIY